MRLLATLLSSSMIPFTLFALPSASTDGMPRPAVGVVMSSGQFAVGHTTGTGTATVLAGDEVDSATLTSRVLLHGGNELALAPHSSGSFYQDHANLLEGSFRVRSNAPFYVTSRNFTVRATGAGSVAMVETNGPALTVNVASGGAIITNSAGQTLAHLAPGTTLSFDSLATATEPAAGADIAANINVSNTSVRLVGVLTKENGHYLVRDRYTNNIFEVQYKEIPTQLVDHLVSVEGTWIGNQKSSLAQIDHVVDADRIAPSDASTAMPCLPDGSGGVLKSIVLNGPLSKIRNHFIVTDAKKGTYEVVGDVDDKELGSDVHQKGFVLPQKATVRPAEHVVFLESRKIVLAASPCAGAVVAGTLITSGVALMHSPSEAGATAAVIKTPISY